MNGESKPVYFRYLTLMAFHVYLEEKVDTAIFECGVGGEYDSTNIITKPSVCAVTQLDIDHVAMLGDTVEDIAWHKAGIFKADCRSDEVLTVAQQPGQAMQVLEERAKAVGKRLQQVERHPQIQDGTIRLGLAADFQKDNASLAVAVVRAHLQVLGLSRDPASQAETQLSSKARKGLENVKWNGRCQTLRDGKITWYIDGGHTLGSIRLAAEWFAACTAAAPSGSRVRSAAPIPEPSSPRSLIFNQQNRDASGLARALHAALSKANTQPLKAIESRDDGHKTLESRRLFTHALFCTNVTFASKSSSSGTGQSQETKNGRYKPDLVSINSNASAISSFAVQHELASTWKELDTGAETEVHATIENAIDSARTVATASMDKQNVAIFVTGSLHLVGGVLEVLQQAKETQGQP